MGNSYKDVNKRHHRVAPWPSVKCPDTSMVVDQTGHVLLLLHSLNLKPSRRFAASRK